jgi:putative oxidoreductase
MKEQLTHPTFLLRFAVAVILGMHSIPSIFTGAVNDFGNHYLNAVGFDPFGLPLAWAIKLTHLISIPLLLMNRFLKPVALSNIAILIAGIIMIHYAEGWFVVGGGRNGVEFNFLLIFSLLTIMLPNGLKQKLSGR